MLPEPIIKSTARNKLEMNNKYHKKVRSIDVASRGAVTSKTTNMNINSPLDVVGCIQPSYFPAADTSKLLKHFAQSNSRH